jgi:2-oxoglutarate dehydrogenase complex dehydrogenase (E1) component-like enzyme
MGPVVTKTRPPAPALAAIYPYSALCMKLTFDFCPRHPPPTATQPQPPTAPQFRGHEAANLDPLGLHGFRSPVPPPELDHKFHGFTDADLDRVMNMRGTSKGGHKGFLSELADGRPVTLRQVVDKLKQTYCQTLGVEYMHMSSREKCNWIRARVETPLWLSYSKEKKLHIFERLAYADHFERFLGNKYNTAKRFGLDGGEAVIPGLKVMIDRASEQGVTDFVFGMPHRGRLNVLVNVLRKPMQQMFQEFQVGPLRVLVWFGVYLCIIYIYGGVRGWGWEERARGKLGGEAPPSPPGA